MTIDKMVVRFKDRRLLKGRTSDFPGDKRSFHLKLLDGKVVKVLIEDLKAAFVVKSFAGNKNHKCEYKDILLWDGHRVRIEFIDGEVMIGYTPYYQHGYQCFSIKPADLKCNNEKVFVVTSAIRDMSYM